MEKQTRAGHAGPHGCLRHDQIIQFGLALCTNMKIEAETAQVVAMAIAHAHGGCSSCLRELANELQHYDSTDNAAAFLKHKPYYRQRLALFLRTVANLKTPVQT